MDPCRWTTLPRVLLVVTFVTLPTMAGASEMAALAAEIGRTAVAMQHHAVNPRTILPVRVVINHQGDLCHFEAVMVWTSGPFGGQVCSTPRRGVVYGSLINRSDLRRLMDLEYVEAPDRPYIGCDDAPKVITYWNTVIARQDTLSPPRELGQPLHRSMHPQPVCEVCPTCPPVIQAEGEQARRPFPKDGEEVLEGDALTRVLNRGRSVQLVGAQSSQESKVSRFQMAKLLSGRKSAGGDAEPADHAVEIRKGW